MNYTKRTFRCRKRKRTPQKPIKCEQKEKKIAANEFGFSFWHPNTPKLITQRFSVNPT